MEIASLKCETEELHAQCKKHSVLVKRPQTVRRQCAYTKEERNVFILRAQRTAAYGEVVRKERDDPKRIAETLRAQHYDGALRRAQLDVLREDRDNLTEEEEFSILEKATHKNVDVKIAVSIAGSSFALQKKTRTDELSRKTRPGRDDVESSAPSKMVEKLSKKRRLDPDGHRPTTRQNENQSPSVAGHSFRWTRVGRMLRIQTFNL